ncbi:DUF2809 domain-containing protein [Streptomyces sp. NPDC015350]|uniref:ribosomal maturation YjgA family protein n=1 Tax=Streptomyces sp. NPDC015350 TaxID=3364955 RepID=UPI0036F53E68
MHEETVAGESRTVRRARTTRRARAVAAGGAVLTVLVGLGVRALADGDFAKYAGDALYTVLICALVAVIAPGARPAVAAGAALAFSWAVELLQLTGIPADLAGRSAVARLVLGSTFNAPDLFWYAVGAGFAWAVAALVTSPSSPGCAPRTSASR